MINCGWMINQYKIDQSCLTYFCSCFIGGHRFQETGRPTLDQLCLNKWQCLTGKEQVHVYQKKYSAAEVANIMFVWMSEQYSVLRTVHKQQCLGHWFKIEGTHAKAVT